MRTVGILLAIAAVACGGDPGPQIDPVVANVVGDTVRAELRVGQTLVLEDVTLRFSAVEEDSRCPTDVVCVWAGNARARLDVSPTVPNATGQTDEPIFVNTTVEPLRAEAGVWVLWIDSLAPEPHSERPPEPEDYRLALVLTRA